MKYFFLLLLFYAVQIQAQKNIALSKEQAIIQKIHRTKEQVDSSTAALNKMMEANKSSADSLQKIIFSEQNNRNLEAYMQSQRIAEKNSKERMWWRLGLGFAFLLLGIYGVTRKRK
ncbi:MAG: hypothetical protein WCJ85_08610 [Chitinophagaceae bacterium]